MPSVQFSLDDLEGLLGKTVPRDKEGLNEILAFVKGDVESLEGDAVSIEVKDSNRPDIWSVEGIARALRYQLGTGRSRQISVAGKSGLKVVVDKHVKAIRPFISTAIVRGLQPSEEALKGWISLQEKLDLTYGRKRKRASIGLYQADMIVSPLSYTVAKPDAASFAPLGSETKSSLREIVANHPKGSEYGEIISGFDEWPILVDEEDKILSLPPVVNSNDLGRITPGTRNILVEVTGTDAETVHNTLKIMVACLAEREGRIYSCVEAYSYGSPRRVVSPNLSPTLSRLSLSHLNKLKPEWPRIWTVGDLSAETIETETLAEIMVGLGFQEILTCVLTSPDVVAGKMQMGSENLVTLFNPKMSTHTVMRSWVLPSLLEFLSRNTHVDYPQKIFEVGASISRAENSPLPVREERKVAAVTIHAQAGFTEIRSSLDALMENVGQSFEVKANEHPSFLSGRCGAVISTGREIGIVGEVNPIVLRAWGLNLPAAAFEVNVSQKTPGV